jgi:hypothetical protein
VIDLQELARAVELQFQVRIRNELLRHGSYVNAGLRAFEILAEKETGAVILRHVRLGRLLRQGYRGE